jgi:hypothetical protein
LTGIASRNPAKKRCFFCLFAILSRRRLLDKSLQNQNPLQPRFGLGRSGAEGVRRSAKPGHGGGDTVLLKDLFALDGKDNYLRAADQRSGAASILCGIAAKHICTVARPKTILTSPN